MSNVIRLLPCPFCGGDAELRCHRRRGEWYHVECGERLYEDHPYVRTGNFRSPEQAAAAWNRRDYTPPKKGGREG